MKVKKHICQEDRVCSCSTIAWEPNEECPIHGAGSYPKRCGICGRFYKYHAEDWPEQNQDNEMVEIKEIQ